MQAYWESTHYFKRLQVRIEYMLAKYKALISLASSLSCKHVPS